MTDNVINQNLKCYMIGPMESTKKKDEGTGWRSRLRPELQKRVDSEGRRLYVFDPTLFEEKKVGYTTKQFHKKLSG